MQTSLLVARMNLLTSFEAMLAQLDAFCTAVRQDDPLPAWVSRTEMELMENQDMRLKAIQLYRALWYEESQDGRETLTCPGIVGASSETLAIANVCNAAKDEFKAAVLALKGLGRDKVNGAMTDLHRRWETVATAMRRLGAARLNLKQAYRHIPLLDRRPLKIGFTWSKQGRVIQRTSVAEARRLLEQRVETPQVQSDLRRLAEINGDEPLARVRGVCPHLRANIVFTELGQGRVSRRLMQAPLPILVPLQRGERLPEFVAVTPEPPSNPRLRRADVRIEDEPFLPSARVYRYREIYR
ncbi:MAG: DNA replication terminus site-binding protein [Candidatus Contendobacter sp.]|nr:DNA replication terminus site-binding protein [Candidatus Contendobacter sp.]